MLKEKHLVTAIKVGLYAALLLPIAYQRTLVYPFVFLKSVAFQGLVEVLFALWLALVLFVPRCRPRLTLLSGAVVALLAALLMSAFLGVDVARSIWSTPDRSIGVFTLAHFVAFFIMLRSFAGEIDWRRYLSFSFLVSVAVAVGGLVQIFNHEILLGPGGRVGSFFGNPTFLAAYLLFHIFIGLWLALDARRRRRAFAILFGGGVLFELVILFFTETRGALLGLVAGFFVVLVALALDKRASAFVVGNSAVGRDRSRLLRKVAMSLLVLSIAGAGVFWGTRDAALWQRVPGVRRVATLSLDAPDLQPRLTALKIAWESFRARPLSGWGWENFNIPFSERYDPRLLRSGFAETYFDKPHNIFLEYLVTTGAIGLTAYLAIFIAAFSRVWQRLRRVPAPENRREKAAPVPADQYAGATLLLGAALAAYLVNNAFVFDTFGSYLMLFVSLAFIDGAESKRVAVPKGQSPPRAFLVPTAAAFLIVACVPLYFVNYRSWRANHYQWWGLNYFLNRLPVDALASYAKALAISHPYTDYIRKDFAANIGEAHAQGISIPNIEAVQEEAVRALQTTIVHHPREYFYRVQLADTITKLYPVSKPYLPLAEEMVSQAIEVSPKRQQSYYVLSKLLLLDGDKNGSLAAMKQAVDLDPEVGEPHFFYGLLLAETGNLEGGIWEVERAKELGREPRSARELRVLGNYYGDAERYDEAIDLYTRAIAFSPDDDDLETTLKLGIVNFYKGDNKQARQYVGEVLEAVPNFRELPSYPQLKPILDALGLEA